MLSVEDNHELKRLTDKIYQEGIAQAKKEAAQILEDAKTEKLKILEAAKQEADALVANAQKEAELLQRNIESNLHLASSRLVSQLKSNIISMIETDVLEKPLKEAFQDVAFLKSLLLEVTKHWTTASELEVFTSPEMKAKMEAGFDVYIKQSLHRVSLHVDQNLEAGFRIAEKGGAYQITFTDMDFMALFRPYLREKTQEILFKSSS